MNHNKRDYLTISVFASNTRLSVKALRLYDRLDLLKPDYTDPSSGYRFYHVEQIHRARLIRMMRLMDMPLTLIRQILSEPDNEAEQLIEAYLEDLRAKVDLAGHVVQTLIQTLRGEDIPMPFEIEVKQVQKQTILSTTHHIKVNQLNQTIRDGVKQLRAIAEENDVTMGVPFGIYHGHIDHESDGPIEVCLPVANAPSDLKDGVQTREIAEGKVVSVQLREKECFFPDILKGYDALTDWMRKNGYEHYEPPHEIWHHMSAPEHLEITWTFREQQ